MSLHEFQTEKVEDLMQELGSGILIRFTTSATPDEETTVAHTLGRVPGGLIVIRRDKGDEIYAGHTAWTTTAIYVKSHTASVTCTALLTFSGNTIASEDPGSGSGS